jgi:hypothetical protein
LPNVNLDQQYKYQDYQSYGGNYYQYAKDREYSHSSYQRQEERGLILSLGARIGAAIILVMIIRAMTKGVGSSDNINGNTSKSTDEKFPYTALISPDNGNRSGYNTSGAKVSLSTQRQYLGDRQRKLLF